MMSPDHIGHRHLSGDKLHITYSSIYTLSIRHFAGIQL